MNIKIVPIDQINAAAYNPRGDEGSHFPVGERPAGWKYKDADRSGSGTSHRIGYQASA